MKVYRLNPIRLNNRRWELSFIKESVWVSAVTPNKAREIVGVKTLVVNVPDNRFRPKLQSPWLDDFLASCVLDTSRNNLPPGDVITANGQPISAS